MNSGDWIENLTALEYNEATWSIYNYANDPVAQAIDIEKKKHKGESSKAMMASLMQELNMKHNKNDEEEVHETMYAEV
jgi:polyribonucleotide nucleotidyltransferase